MDIIFKNEVIIKEAFRDLLKRQKYEYIVSVTLNRSQKLICNLPLTAVEEQPNGECDYLDSKNRKYETKLLIDTKQGSLIGERKNNLNLWIQSMIQEASEFSESIRQRDLSSIENMKLYMIMQKALNAVKIDEVAVLFIPYPIVYDYPEFTLLQLTTDFLQAVYDKLVDKTKVLCKRVLFLYPSMEKGVVVLRDANSREREYIKLPEMNEYISYRVMATMN